MVSEVREAPGFFSLATLERSRALVALPGNRVLAISLASAYAVLSMLTGGMLTIFYPPAHVSSFSQVFVSGTPWWNYPALLAEGPAGSLALPFLPTVLMVLVSVGVGIGMTVAVLLALRLVRERRVGQGGAATLSSAAGLTPAMIALITLGACCSTTAAATAGVAGVAQASGTTVDNLLLNNWYLGIFQVAILWVGLFAQEQLLVVYGVIFGLEKAGPTPLALPPPGFRRRAVTTTALRFALLVGGVTWALTVLTDWTTVSPLTASATQWYGWVFEHGLVSGAAVLLALYPEGVYAWARSSVLLWPKRLARFGLFVGGITLLIGVPARLVGFGAPGLIAEMLGAFGVGPAFGGTAPPIEGIGLLFRWGFQFALLGMFALTLALSPSIALGATLSPSRRPGALASVPAGGTRDSMDATPPASPVLLEHAATGVGTIGTPSARAER
ncbi:MAG: hypothetical protein L3K09_04910 [Thermoplasmata archaeon]|nr:hypothetical protein [Thermoplasmata archaeon]